MIEGVLLQHRLDAVRDALRNLRRRRAVVIPLMVCALVTAILAWQRGFGWRHIVWLVPLVTVVWALLARWWAGRRRESDLELARLVEAAEPELNARLITAVEILNRATTRTEGPEFLEGRVIQEALDHEDAQTWVDSVTGRRLNVAARWATLAIYLFAAAFLWLVVGLRHGLEVPMEKVASGSQEQVEKVDEQPLVFEVKPGAVEVELNARLVVEAKISPRSPPEAQLVWTDQAGKVLGSTEMAAGVDGETFGGLIARVDQDLWYRVEAQGEKSEAFPAKTFVFPKLERLDVVIVPPKSTGLPEREVRNTLKVAAPEFSEVRFKARINKPVVVAELFGEDESVIPLQPSKEDPLQLEGRIILERSGRYRLHLVDDKERANVKPPWITLTAQPNLLAKIEVVFPKRDLQVSALQELPVEARVWDDLGVTRSGASLSVAGQAREVVFKHEVSAPNQKIDLKELVDLEREGAMPRQLLTYHFWAEDKGPNGEVRRALSDMFFAQVRPFEDVFREGEPPPSSPGMPGGSQAGKLLALQKQVVNATWRIQRDTLAGRELKEAADDVGVVRESQAMALEQTKEQMEETEDVEIKQALTEAWKSMRDAMDGLAKAEEEAQRAALTQALEHEQAALQWLYQASEREHLVTRQKPNQSAAGGGQKEREEQLMNLELKQEEQRYEEESQAMAEQSPQQQENLEVLSRLKELARRQEALAKQMQELREQMAKAESESERQELADQLQRLQQEQEDLLRGLDDLQEQLDRSENAANLAETRDQLEKAREQAVDAAEELAKEDLAAASNAATRAERDLKQMEEDFRQKTARRFSEEMREMKRAAQEIASAQERISGSLENQKTPEGAERGDTSNAMERMLNGSEVARALAEQQERVKNLLGNLQGLSEQAEAGEPLLSRRLYESVRAAQTGGLEENLEDARLQSRYGNRAEAQEAERQAATAVEQLARNVNQAAETVLGSESESLRMARNELDRLIEEVEKEAGGQATSQAQEVGTEQADTKSRESGTGGNPQDPAQDQADGSPTPKPSTEEAAKGELAANPGQNKGSKSDLSQRDETGEGQPGVGTEADPKAQASQAGQSEGQGQEGQGRSENMGASGSVRDATGASERAPAGGPRLASGTGSGRGEDGAAAGGTGWFFEEAAEEVRQGPLTGEGFRDWVDRLGVVEELLENAEMANEAARVSDNARAMRLEQRRNNQAPQADELRARITQPLLELRDRVMEELARKGSENPNVPIDRDPVPPSYKDMVRRYYTELGEGR